MSTNVQNSFTLGKRATFATNDFTFNNCSAAQPCETRKTKFHSIWCTYAIERSKFEHQMSGNLMPYYVPCPFIIFRDHNFVFERCMHYFSRIIVLCHTSIVWQTCTQYYSRWQSCALALVIKTAAFCRVYQSQFEIIQIFCDSENSFKK
jgi:hypothetical protein